jgi:hypothetical protein
VEGKEPEEREVLTSVESEEWEDRESRFSSLVFSFLGERPSERQRILHFSIFFVLVVPALEETEHIGEERVKDVVEEVFGMREDDKIEELELPLEKVRGVASASCVVE